jgi:MFS family permease
MAVFYVAASLAGAFSGLLAFGIEKLDGRAGLTGWQWIFLIEGLVPVALALVIWKILPNSPETAAFLTQAERDLLVRRLADDSGSGQGKATNNDKMGMKHIVAGLSDWKIWAAVVIFWGNTVGVYGYVMTYHCGILVIANKLQDSRQLFRRSSMGWVTQAQTHSCLRYPSTYSPRL